MAFSITGNYAAQQAYNALATSQASTQKAQLQLASQKRINSAADDTSGYRVSSELKTKVDMMKSAMANVESAKSFLSTGESALSSINDLLTQIKGKIADATDPTKNQTALANDIKALGDEISSIFTNTKFNDTAILSGTSVSASMNSVFQTGADTTDKTTINFISTAAGYLNSLDLSSITSSGSTAVDGSSTHAISNLSSTIDTLQSTVQDALGSIGNYTQRLDVKSDYLTSAMSNAQSTIDNLTGADVAQQQLNATKDNIAQQISTTMLSQLNSAPQQLLSLFR